MDGGISFAAIDGIIIVGWSVDCPSSLGLHPLSPWHPHRTTSHPISDKELPIGAYSPLHLPFSVAYSKLTEKLRMVCMDWRDLYSWWLFLLRYSNKWTFFEHIEVINEDAEAQRFTIPLLLQEMGWKNTDSYSKSPIEVQLCCHHLEGGKPKGRKGNLAKTGISLTYEPSSPGKLLDENITHWGKESIWMRLLHRDFHHKSPTGGNEDLEEMLRNPKEDHRRQKSGKSWLSQEGYAYILPWIDGIGVCKIWELGFAITFRDREKLQIEGEA